MFSYNAVAQWVRTLQSKDPFPPQNYSCPSVMVLAVPVAVRFLQRGNRELSRNMSSYLSLAAIAQADLLAEHTAAIIRSVLEGRTRSCSRAHSHRVTHSPHVSCSCAQHSMVGVGWGGGGVTRDGDTSATSPHLSLSPLCSPLAHRPWSVWAGLCRESKVRERWINIFFQTNSRRFLTAVVFTQLLVVDMWLRCSVCLLCYWTGLSHWTRASQITGITGCSSRPQPPTIMTILFFFDVEEISDFSSLN